MNKQHWQDSAIIILGFWVFVSPWVLEHTLDAVSPNVFLGQWNLWFIGPAIVVIAIMALVRFSAWYEWINLILGAWLLVSPWILGFSPSAVLTSNAVVSGLALMVSSGWTLFAERAPKQEAR